MDFGGSRARENLLLGQPQVWWDCRSGHEGAGNNHGNSRELWSHGLWGSKLYGGLEHNVHKKWREDRQWVRYILRKGRLIGRFGVQ